MHQERLLKLGAWVWVLCVQYYIVQLIVAAAWTTPPYSWAHNTISDLANTVCAPYGERFVCSPLHGYMNASFILLGLTMIFGACLLGAGKMQNYIARFGLGCMAVSGVGTILVGLYPENTIANAHILGAGLAFVVGNIGMLLAGWKLADLPTWLRILSVAAAVGALTSLGFFVAGQYIGLGLGGLERVIGYPQSVWMVVVGIVLLFQRSNR